VADAGAEQAEEDSHTNAQHVALDIWEEPGLLLSINGAMAREDVLRQGAVMATTDEPVDIVKARAFLRQRFETKQRQRRERLREARADFDSIVRMLVEHEYAARIYQWGSLLDEKRFTEISDIDIALEGCPSAEAFFSAYGEAAELTRFPLDMIELDKVEPLHAESIKRKGRLVYDAQTGSS